MTVRKYLESDNEIVAQLEKECFPSEPWTLQMIQSSASLDNFVGFVACDGEDVIGYVMAVYCIDEADILNVAVKNSYRKQGIGGMLLSKLLSALKEKGVAKAFLEVRMSNLPAKELYKKHRFTEIGVRKNYYADSEDAVVMKSDIV